MTTMAAYVLGPLKQAVRGLPGQLRAHAFWYGAGILLVILLGLVNIYLQQNTNVEVTEMFEDPVAFAGLPLYIGVYTYLIGTMLIVSGVMLVFAAIAAPELAPEMRKYLIAFGVLLFTFGFDDIFMVHEWVGLKLAEWRQSDDVGLDRQWLETPVFAAYAVAWVTLMIVFSRQVLRTAWILLLLTFFSFGLSIVLDLWQFLEFMPQPNTRAERLVTEVGEEIFKFAGAVFAAFYTINVAYLAVRGRYASGSENAQNRTIG